MNRVVLDIETIGVDFEKLDEKSQEYLLKFSESEEEKNEVKQRLALYPFTGEVVVIGMLNPDTGKGKMFYQCPEKPDEAWEEGGFRCQAGNEKEILSLFWEDIKNYQQIITFNGRGFDGPFLHLRSAINKITPSRNLVPYRYEYRSHCDLLDQLTYYGATRKFNLHFYAKSLGIKSPKEDGVNGLEVGKMYQEGKYKEIVRYCMGDLIATKELFDYWDKYLRF
jgi:3'-5' exonuclease